MSELTTTIAKALLPRIKARRKEYAEECEEYAKQGFRPQYCIHGVNLWTDYDPICGWCEDGDGTPYEQALRDARNIASVYEKRRALADDLTRAAGQMFGEYPHMDMELKKALIVAVTAADKFANEFVSKYVGKEGK